MRANNILLLVILIGFTTPVFSDGKWQSLFNGKDLNGWKANILPESFTVENGLLKAHCKDPAKRKSHLFFVGNQENEFILFKNFEFEASVLCKADSNSGVFIHTDEEIRDDKYHLKNGYEVQINSKASEKRKTGSLYEIVDIPESPVKEAEWFKLNIKVVDKQITVSINGTQLVDYTEPEKPERSEKRLGRVLRTEGGAIALQGHDPDSIVYFEDIRVRRLD
ncbi:DUF1080 domain-containing protein [Opitutia bacterium ISCC 51]|nr:DUF1080 domain-containing protein [Opitutae bacterium ISCC 51]QXD27190.1 DUF1080 domain-containing protein [Opitutae bacterium ISCC 52]